MDKLKLDYFIDENKKIYQHKDHFHFNTDTKLLARFAKIKKGDRVLDIGCNNAALLYGLDESSASEFTGVEINEDACQVARLNVDQFFKHPCRIVNTPIQDFKEGNFDVIVSNPPFFPVRSTHPDIKVSPRQTGRVEYTLNLQELIESAFRLLKSNGRFYFVHRPNRLNDIFFTLHAYHFQVKHIQFAYDKGACKSVLIEAIKEGNCDSIICDPIELSC